MAAMKQEFTRLSELKSGRGSYVRQGLRSMLKASELAGSGQDSRELKAKLEALGL